jgi:hypothetical protein
MTEASFLSKFLDRRGLRLLLLAVILGYASWVVPPLFIPGTETWNFPVFIHPLTNNGLALKVAIVCLIVSGVILGVWGSWRAMILAPVTSLQLILFLFIEAELGLGSHQLLPLEIPLYLALIVPAIVGALIGYVARGLIVKDW